MNAILLSESKPRITIRGFDHWSNSLVSIDRQNIKVNSNHAAEIGSLVVAELDSESLLYPVEVLARVEDCQKSSQGSMLVLKIKEIPVEQVAAFETLCAGHNGNVAA